MRLLHKKTLEMRFFVNEQRPPYLILSHRWLGQETSLQDFLTQRFPDPGTTPADGVAKVLQFCKAVHAHEAEWVWVDTCCIDKTSSAELQEAINSMYQWYEDAAACWVFLDDVSFDGDGGGDKEDDRADEGAEGDDHVLEDPLDSQPWMHAFSRSQWFTRGWTLQELLAPKEQVFVDRDWRLLADRKDLVSVLSRLTGIDGECFGNKTAIQQTIVARRMAWMSKRTTTRAEDIAYCMLGIFDVNMTMLYGEGKRAFIRLQREIINTIDDETLLVWVPPEGSPASAFEYTGCLAPSPRYFESTPSGLRKAEYIDREPYRLTSRGLEIEIPRTTPTARFDGEYMLTLNCNIDGLDVTDRFIFLNIYKQPDSQVWCRKLEKRVHSVWKDWKGRADSRRLITRARAGSAGKDKLNFDIGENRYKIYISIGGM